MESRVGKVAGVRARKRTISQHMEPPRPSKTNARDAIQNGQSTESTRTSNAPVFAQESNEAVSQWMRDSNGQTSDLESLESLSQFEPAANGPVSSSSNRVLPLSSASDLDLPAMDFNIDDLMRYPLEQSHFDMIPPLQEPESGQIHNPEFDSQCVITCCQVVTELESCNVAGIKSLHIVLGIVRKAVEKLNDLVRLQQESRSFKCMALFGVLMYQLIELLENGCGLFLDTDPTRKNSFASQVHGMLPGLSLGYFGMDAEEQSSWRCHVVLKEIRQTSEVLQRIKKLSGVGESGHSDGASTQEQRERCFVDLEKRLKNLSDRVTAES
jgi:hypothetical protein